MWQWIIALLGSTIGVGTLVCIVFFILLILSAIDGSSTGRFYVAILFLSFALTFIVYTIKNRIARTSNKEELLSENYKKKYEEARKRNIKTFIIWGIITLAIVAGILFFSLHK